MLPTGALFWRALVAWWIAIKGSRISTWGDVVERVSQRGDHSRR
jgi:hypothetical protein